jgi:large subunit ribosomal protein L34e
MVRLSLRRLKKTKTRLPSGKLKTVYKKGKTSKHKCALCDTALAGTPRGRPIEISRITKSNRRPTRPFGGQLCSKCTRKIVALKAKLKLKLINADDIPLSLRTYVIGDRTWIKV